MNHHSKKSIQAKKKAYKDATMKADKEAKANKKSVKLCKVSVINKEQARIEALFKADAWKLSRNGKTGIFYPESQSPVGIWDNDGLQYYDVQEMCVISANSNDHEIVSYYEDPARLNRFLYFEPEYFQDDRHEESVLRTFVNNLPKVSVKVKEIMRSQYPTLRFYDFAPRSLRKAYGEYCYRLRCQQLLNFFKKHGIDVTISVDLKHSSITDPITVPDAADQLHCSQDTVLKVLRVLKDLRISASPEDLLPPKENNLEPNRYCFGGFYDSVYDSDHTIPSAVQTAISTASNGAGDWQAVGTALAEHMLAIWPEGKQLDREGTGIAAMPEKMDSEYPINSDFSTQMFQLLWLHFRFPTVIEAVPTDQVFEVVRAVMAKMPQSD